MCTIFTYKDIGSTKNESQACFPIDNSESLFKSDCYKCSTVFIIVFSCRIYNGTHCIVSISVLVFLVLVIGGYMILFIVFIKSDCKSTYIVHCSLNTKYIIIKQLLQ